MKIMKSVRVYMMLAFLALFCCERADAQPSEYLLKNSIAHSDSSITFSQVGFKPGESLDLVGKRFDSMPRRYGIEHDDDQNSDFLVPFSNVIWSGMSGRGWIQFDSLDHAKKLHLDFEHETFDTMYLRLSRIYGLPEREVFVRNDSLWVAFFRDGNNVIELGLDSGVRYPAVICTYPGVDGSSKYDEPRAKDRRWAHLSGSSERTRYVDTGVYAKGLITIKEVPSDSTLRAIKQDASAHYPTLGYEKFAYRLFTYKCDCERGMISTLRILDCSYDDKPIYFFPTYPDWAPMKPKEGTAEYWVCNYVCNKKNYSK